MFTQKTLLTFILKRGAIALGAVVIAVIAASLLSAQIDASVQAVITHKKLTATLQARNEVVSKLLTDYQNVRGYDQRIQGALLAVSDILEFVSALESLASKDNMMQATHFGDPVIMAETIGDPPRPLYKIDFTLSTQGNIFTFLHYIADIERLPYFMKINSISFSAQSPAGWLNTSNISVGGTLYTQGDE